MGAGISDALTDEGGNTVSYLGTISDISARKAAYAEAESQRLRAEHYLDIADIILIALDATGHIIRANERARRLLEIPGMPLVGSDWFARCLPDADRWEVERVFERLLARDATMPTTYENTIALPDGSTRHVQWHNSVVQGTEGEALEVLALGLDVTELRNAESIRIESEAKDRFLANMSHELRTPLNSIIGFSSVLLDGLADPLTAEQYKQVSIINQAGRYLLELVDDLLDVEQIVRGRASVRMSTTTCAELVVSVVEQTRPDVEAAGLELVVDTCEPSTTLRTDTRKVRQILLNLISNAIKFTEVGTITVTASCAPEQVTVRVSDTGIGMAPEVLERIFDLYYQAVRPDVAKSSGAGLGLSLSRSYARLLGGDLTAESTEGRGSTFILVLPTNCD